MASGSCGEKSWLRDTINARVMVSAMGQGPKSDLSRKYVCAILYERWPFRCDSNETQGEYIPT